MCVNLVQHHARKDKGNYYILSLEGRFLTSDKDLPLSYRILDVQDRCSCILILIHHAGSLIFHHYLQSLVSRDLEHQTGMN